MKDRQLVVFVVVFLFLSMAAACAQGQQAPPESEALEVEVTREVVQVQEVEVTREVELEVEVTREVEVEATRLVEIEVMVTREVTVLPENFFVGGVWYGGQFAYMPEGKFFQFESPSHSIVNEGEWSVDGNIRTLRITDGVCAGKTIRFETTSVRSMNEVTHVLIQSSCEDIGNATHGTSLVHGRTPFYDWQRELLVERGYDAEDLQ